jgi:hypothetical protein
MTSGKGQTWMMSATRVLAGLWGSLLGLASGLGCFDQLGSGQPIPGSVGLAFTGLGTYIVIRSTRIGVNLTDRTLVIRSLFRTRRLNASEIVHARATAYVGFLSHGVQSSTLGMLRLETASGRIHDFPDQWGLYFQVQSMSDAIDHYLRAARLAP